MLSSWLPNMFASPLAFNPPLMTLRLITPITIGAAMPTTDLAPFALTPEALEIAPVNASAPLSPNSEPSAELPAPIIELALSLPSNEPMLSSRLSS